MFRDLELLVSMFVGFVHVSASRLLGCEDERGKLASCCLAGPSIVLLGRCEVVGFNVGWVWG